MSAVLGDQTLSLNTQVAIPMDQFPLAYVSWIVLINASPFALKCSFGGNQFFVPAWYYYPVEVAGDAPQTPTILPYLQTIPGTNTTKVLSTILYMNNEEPPSKLASPLGGGPVDLTVASSIVNVNSAPGTQVVFAEPVGDTSGTGATNITNNGQIILGDVGQSGIITVASPTLAQTVIDPGFIQITDTSGANQSFANDGLHAIKLFLTAGNITRISSFTAAVTTVTTAFNHNLGAVPDIVLLTVQGGVSTIRTCVYDPATMTTTQVSLTGSASFTVIGLAIKF